MLRRLCISDPVAKWYRYCIVLRGDKVLTACIMKARAGEVGGMWYGSRNGVGWRHRQQSTRYKPSMVSAHRPIISCKRLAIL